MNLRVNDQIKLKEARVLLETEQLGIMPFYKAKEIAANEGLDIIEIVPQAKPPVVKITDYGKYKYELSKKEKADRKKQKAAKIDVKELRFRPTTTDHDIGVMLTQAEKFLEKGNRVKFCIRPRGRELARLKEFILKMSDVIDRIEADTVFVEAPKVAGRQIICIIEKS